MANEKLRIRQENDYKKEPLKIFFKYYLSLNNNQTDSQSYLFDSHKRLTTDIFKDGKLWYKNALPGKYEIFRCSFTTAIFSISVPLFLDDKETINILKIFIPTSSLDTFDVVNDDEMISNNFQKSNTMVILK